MTTYSSRLLTPPSEEEEVRLYRPVWRSISFEYAILFGVTVALFVLFNLLDFASPDALRVPLNIALVLLPVVLWLIFSLLPERTVPQPRTRLVAVLLVSALTANGIGLPFIDEFLRVEQALSLTTATQRIIGYTFTVGIVQEGLKYIVLRTMIWTEHLRVRSDAVAYAAAVALGYATVLNLQFALTGSPSPDVVVARVFSTLAIGTVAAALTSYGLSESRFSDASALLLPLTLALAAFIVGLATPLRSGLINANLDLETLAFAVPRPLFGIGFALVLIVGGLIVVAFLFNAAERQELERRIEQE